MKSLYKMELLPSNDKYNLILRRKTIKSCPVKSSALPCLDVLCVVSDVVQTQPIAINIMNNKIQRLNINFKDGKSHPTKKRKCLIRENKNVIVHVENCFWSIIFIQKISLMMLNVLWCALG